MGPTVTVRQRSARSVANIVASVEESPNVSLTVHVVLERWASLTRRCGEFFEIILPYILTKSN